jgi:hypothetical protein
MCVLKLTLGKIFFFVNFPSVFVFQCEALGRSPLEFGRVWLRRLDGQVTRPNADNSTICLCGIPRLDGLVMHPDGYPTGLRIAFFSSRRISLLFPLSFSRFFPTFWFPFLVFSHEF